MIRPGTAAAIVLIAALLGGCGGLHPTPYNGRLACDAVGGMYTEDGRCLAGNASLGTGAGGAAPGPLELELGYGTGRPLDLPLARPDVRADTAQAIHEMEAREMEARRKAEALSRGQLDPTRRPDLDRDVTQGIQSRGLDRAIGR